MTHPSHSWDVTPGEALAVQYRLRGKVVLKDKLGKVDRVAGTDVGFEEDGAVARAAVAVLTYPELELADYEEPAQNRGAWQPLTDHGDTIGAVLRTRSRVQPIYVSPGHRISLATAVNYVMACVTRFRLPETTRSAHRLTSGPLDAIDKSPANRHNR